jgi:SAM-dependent methyltransferase
MDKTIYDYYIESNIQENHWWFKSRNNIILAVLKNFLVNTDSCGYEILDIGCGLGQIFPILGKFGHLEGIEKNSSFVKVLKDKYPDIKVHNVEFPNPNLKNKKFDLISMFDFLEHIDNPTNILRTTTNILKNNGLLIVTVPAYNWMRSKLDELGHHYKRYDKNTLRIEIEKEGFKCIYSSYFMTLLFPLVIISRKIIPFLFFKKHKSNDLELKKPINILNKFFYHLMNIEAYFIRREISLTYGLSIISVFKKKNYS